MIKKKKTNDCFLEQPGVVLDLTAIMWELTVGRIVFHRWLVSFLKIVFSLGGYPPPGTVFSYTVIKWWSHDLQNCLNSSMFLIDLLICVKRAFFVLIHLV